MIGVLLEHDVAARHHVGFFAELEWLVRMNRAETRIQLLLQQRLGRVGHHDVGAAVEGCYVVGLHTSLSRLVPTLAGGPVAWDWDEFAVAQAAYAALGLAPTVTAS